MSDESFDFDTVAVLWNSIKPPESPGAVPVKAFCDASEQICKIFDAIKGMGTPKADIIGNVAKIRKNITDEDALLCAMVDAEDQPKPKEGSTGLALLWLKRALYLVEGIMAKFVEMPDAEFKAVVRRRAPSACKCTTSATCIAWFIGR